MFEHENPLPGAELHPPTGDRDRFARAGKHHAQMAWHVVRSFGRVDKVVGVFRDKPAKKLVEIGSRRTIRVFVDHETRTGVLDEDGNDSLGHAAIADDSRNLIRDFVRSLAASGDLEMAGVRCHGL